MNAQPRVLVSRTGRFTDCNCACADGEEKAEPPLCIDGLCLWREDQQYASAPLDADHIVCISPAGNGAVAVLNQAAQHLLKKFRTPESFTAFLSAVGSETLLCTEAFSALAYAGLVIPWPPQARPAPASRMLTAWLHLTHACNLRCTYCFDPHNTQRMSESVGKRAVAATFRTAVEEGFTSVKLKYAGGEPTLVFDLVQALHHHAQQAVQRTRITLHELLLSNGVHLTDAAIQYLRDECIDVMISLDGVGVVHDRQRPTVHGKETFAAVASTIDRCLAHGVAPDLSITVTAQNVSELAQVVEFALDRNLRFNLNFVRTHDAVAAAVRPTEDAALIDGVRAALGVIQHRLPPYRLIDGLLDRSTFNTAHEYACGAGRNYLAFAPDGQVARCHTQLHAPVAGVDDPRLLTAVRSATTPGALQSVATTQREGCPTCHWRAWCGGGCPLLAHQTTGAWDQRSPYCSVYQALYPEVLRTEGLRILKYAVPPVRV
jgi:uncharacterized protein